MPAAAALLLFGLVTALLALQLPLGTLRAPGTALFPLALGAMLMVLAAAQAVQIRLSKPKAPPAPAAPANDGGTRRVLLFMVVVALATALLQLIGYVASAFLLMLGLLAVLGVRWGAAALVAALSAAGSHLLFVRWLKIPMPAGPLGF
jgi:hypothetical protein